MRWLVVVVLRVVMVVVVSLLLLLPHTLLLPHVLPWLLHAMRVPGSVCAGRIGRLR